MINTQSLNSIPATAMLFNLAEMPQQATASGNTAQNSAQNSAQTAQPTNNTQQQTTTPKGNKKPWLVLAILTITAIAVARSNNNTN